MGSLGQGVLSPSPKRMTATVDRAATMHQALSGVLSCFVSLRRQKRVMSG